MPPISPEPGMLIIHPWHPRWGPGKIVCITGRIAYVFFRDNLQRKASRIDLLRTRIRFPTSQTDPVLDRLPRCVNVEQDWILPADFKQQMIDAEVSDTELAIRHGLDQARIGRISLSTATVAVSHLRSMWMTLENDCFEIFPDGATPTAPRPLEEAIAIAAPAFAEPDHKHSVPSAKPWLVGLSDEFMRLATGVGFEQQRLILDLIVRLASSPMVNGDAFACMGDTQLWLYREGSLRIVYKPDDDSRQVILLAIAPPVGRFS